MSTDDDQLTADSLRRLRSAARVLPADRAAELIEEITAHIAEARAGGASGFAASPGVRNILDRLGDPADIVRAAAEAMPGSAAPARAQARTGSAGAGPLEIIAVILLLIGGIVIPVVGWIVGVILLWVSPRWQRREKLIGTLVWPGGLLAALALPGFALIAVHVAVSRSSAECGGAACSSSGGLPSWLGISLAVIVIAAALGGPIWTAVRLLRRAGAPAAEPAAGAAEFQGTF